MTEVIGTNNELSIDFRAGGNITDFGRAGWCPPEPEYTWTSGVESALELPRPSQPGAYLLGLTLRPFVWLSALPAQQLVIAVNGKEVGTHMVRGPASIECRLPWRLIEARPTISIVFRHPDAAVPAKISGAPDDRVIALAFERVTLTRSLEDDRPHEPLRNEVASSPEAPATDATGDLSLQELLMRFENLGENCEFGLVQRRCSAEPLGLLRFSSTPLPQLIKAMKARFEGVGRPEYVEVKVSDSGREYMVMDRNFGFLYHPWIKLGEAEPSEIHHRECRRLPFLTKKLIDDLEYAEKIFVFKGMEPPAETDVRQLFGTMQEYGPTTLLWVALQNEGNPAGRVKEIAPGLLKGYIDRFAPGENAHDLSFETWVDICRKAYDLHVASRHKLRAV